MSHYFTHYWRNQTCDASQQSTGALLIVNARNNFIRRGVSIGDFIYSITLRHGILYLIGYLEVGAIFPDRYTAATHLGVLPHDLWPASDQLIARRATPHRFDRAVPFAITHQLRLIQDKKVVAPIYEDTDQKMLDRQTFRGIRELTGESANLLNNLAEPLQQVEAAHIQDWKERL